MSTSTVTVSAETADAVKAVDVHAAAATIPAGLSTDLLTATIVVYSELVSRSDAMALFRSPGVYDRRHVDPQVAPNAEQLLQCLAHGTAAARAFPADLRSLERLAASLPPVDIAAPTSRAAAESPCRSPRWILSTVVPTNAAGRWCADSRRCGGTAIRAVRRRRAAPLGGNLGDFDAKYRASHGWVITIHVC